ncbi:MAG: hypothetical protein K2X27_09615 [Candidatus Obscuribacterales bacterium]|nr:hypothetical protein [Candidatus Obscuribacterales bacterium]
MKQNTKMGIAMLCAIAVVSPTLASSVQTRQLTVQVNTTATPADSRTSNLSIIKFQIGGAGCLSCRKAVETTLHRNPGVLMLSVEKKLGEFRPSATVTIDKSKISKEQVAAQVGQLNFEVIALSEQNQNCSPLLLKGWPKDLFWCTELNSDSLLLMPAETKSSKELELSRKLEAQLRFARNLIQSGKVEESISLLMKLNSMPLPANEAAQRRRIRLTLACALMFTGRYDQVQELCRTVLSEKTNSYAALRLLSQIAYESTNYPEALLQASELVKNYPQKEGSYEILEQCFDKLNAPAADYQVLVRQSKKHLKSPEFQSFLAEQCLKRASVLTTNHPAQKQTRENWYLVAETAYKNALLSCPENLEWRLQLVRVLLKERKNHEALVQWQIASKKDPQKSKVLESRMLKIWNWKHNYAAILREQLRKAFSSIASVFRPV